jgi:hypothetical protein
VVGDRGVQPRDEVVLRLEGLDLCPLQQVQRRFRLADRNTRRRRNSFSNENRGEAIICAAPQVCVIYPLRIV